MSELLEKCEVCLALLDEEDLFCGNCGREAPERQQPAESTKTQTSTYNFECRGCGASMSYDASAQTLRCPFCGSTKLEEQQDLKVLAPDWIVPFEVSHEQAVATMRKFLGNGYWRPRDLAKKAVIENMTGVYVPYWVFSARTKTYWCADTSQTPSGARSDWYPISGNHQGEYSGVLIGASSTLAPGETAVLCPFDLSRAKQPHEVDTENITVEQFRVQRKYARPLARQAFEELERSACNQYVPGRSRNVHVNTRLDRLSSSRVLLPIWIMAYRYQNHLYRFLVNGQTGRSTGQAPFSYAKLGKVLGIGLAVLLAVFVGMGICGGLASMMP